MRTEQSLSCVFGKRVCRKCFNFPCIFFDFVIFLGIINKKSMISFLEIISFFWNFKFFFLGYVWSFNLLGFRTNFRFVNLVFRWFYFVRSDIFWFLCPAAEDFWFFLYWHYCICCRSGWKNLRIRYLEVLCHLRQKNWSDVPFLKVGDWELRSFRH